MFNKIKEKIKSNKFNIILICILLFIFIFSKKVTESNNKDLNTDINEIKIFVQDGCPHCIELEEYLKTIDVSKYNIKFYNLSNERKNYNLLIRYVNKHNVPITSVGTPFISYKNSYLVGFYDKTEFKEELMNIFNKSLEINFDIQKENSTFYNILQVILMSIINFYSMIVIILLTSILVLFNNSNKKKLTIIGFFLSFCIIFFLSLIEWLDIFIIAHWTRLLNLILGLFILFYSIRYLYFTIYKKGQNIFFNENKKLDNKFILGLVCLAFMNIIIMFTQNDNLYLTLINDLNSLYFLIKYFIIFVITLIIPTITILIIVIINKIINKLIINNNSKINIEDIFSLVLFFIGFYLTFIMNY